MQTSPDTERVVRFYTEAWTHHDLPGVRQIIAPDAEIEWNMDAPVDDEQVVQVLDRIATRSGTINLVSEAYSGDRAVLLYDCAAAFGTARIAEFLLVDGGRIAEMRQVYDLAAIRRYFPDLLDDLA